jgi:cobalt-precorrin 5A hydrolase
MALGEGLSMLAIGIGCRRGVSAEAIVALVRRALESVDASAGAALFTIAGKETERALYDAAAVLGLSLAFLPRETLAERSDEAQTKSERVVALFGVPSVAETAALAGAGVGAKLIAPRIVDAGVTCAIAQSVSEPRT